MIFKVLAAFIVLMGWSYICYWAGKTEPQRAAAEFLKILKEDDDEDDEEEADDEGEN